MTCSRGFAGSGAGPEDSGAGAGDRSIVDIEPIPLVLREAGEHPQGVLALLEEGSALESCTAPGTFALWGPDPFSCAFSYAGES